MGKSARIIGREDFGLSAREMNVLLKQHGYLYGEPGAYGVTEKGKQFGEEQYHENGYGGYAHRSWEVTTWNEDLAAALRADMAANPEDGIAEDAPVDEEVEEDDDYYYTASSESDSRDLSAKDAAVVGSVLVGGFLAWKFGPPLWRNHIKPRTMRLRDRLLKKEPAATEAREVGEGPA